MFFHERPRSRRRAHGCPYGSDHEIGHPPLSLRDDSTVIVAGDTSRDATPGDGEAGDAERHCLYWLRATRNSMTSGSVAAEAAVGPSNPDARAQWRGAVLLPGRRGPANGARHAFVSSPLPSWRPHECVYARRDWP
jgi:hypothetical protein